MLSQIYQYIIDKFPYYNKNKKGKLLYSGTIVTHFIRYTLYLW